MGKRLYLEISSHLSLKMSFDQKRPRRLWRRRKTGGPDQARSFTIQNLFSWFCKDLYFPRKKMIYFFFWENFLCRFADGDLVGVMVKRQKRFPSASSLVLYIFATVGRWWQFSFSLWSSYFCAIFNFLHKFSYICNLSFAQLLVYYLLVEF